MKPPLRPARSTVAFAFAFALALVPVLLAPTLARAEICDKVDPLHGWAFLVPALGLGALGCWAVRWRRWLIALFLPVSAAPAAMIDFGVWSLASREGCLAGLVGPAVACSLAILLPTLAGLALRRSPARAARA